MQVFVNEYFYPQISGWISYSFCKFQWNNQALLVFISMELFVRFDINVCNCKSNYLQVVLFVTESKLKIFFLTVTVRFDEKFPTERLGNFADFL